MNNNLYQDQWRELDPEMDETARMLNDMAEHIQPDTAFAVNLEHRLISAHLGPKTSTVLTLRRLAPALLWVLAVALMVLVVNWAIRSLAPEPVPAARSTKTPMLSAPTPPVDQAKGTPVPSDQGYAWHGTTLYLATALPNNPLEADVYLAQPIQHATTEDALALAGRFGIQGELYTTRGEMPDTTDYLVTDGKQSLRVRSTDYFSYTADIVRAYNFLQPVQKPDAESVIKAFLQSHGFTFPYRMQWSDFRSAYVLELLSPSGTPLRYEAYSPPMMAITLDPAGGVATLQASLLAIEDQTVGRYGIISADEAFQRLRDENAINGMFESRQSISPPIQQWNRAYPLDQTITIYGTLSIFASTQADGLPFMQIDGFPAAGAVSGLDKLPESTYVEASGHLAVENGIQRFEVESWKVPAVHEEGLIGTLDRKNDQVVIDTQDGAHYVVPDVPADVPMPFENAYVIGTAEGDIFQWKMIDTRMGSGQSQGGGGGGGGTGFYKLNLTGTPVAFPSPTSVVGSYPSENGTQYTVQAGDTLSAIAAAHGTDLEALMRANNISDPGMLYIGQVLVIPGSDVRSIEGLRGMLNVGINRQPDGSELASYGFIANASGDPSGYMLLEGEGLDSLQAYNNRPVDVWGTYKAPLDGSIPVVQVERFEIPFPDLKFQVLQGTQRIVEIAGQPATLFTAQDGQIYVQLLSDGTTGNSLIGQAGDQVQIECLAIPGESVGGYPGLRIFAGGLAVNPKTGQPQEMPITADKPSIAEMPPMGRSGDVPTATIEKIELVHFLSDPRYGVPQADAQPPYFQPAWRFYGHYSNGDEFEIMIQALQKEYLLPEIEPGLQPG